MGFYLTEQLPDSAAENRPATYRPRLASKTPIGAPFSNPILSTKYWDGDTKLLYFGHRYDSPSLGRWLSRDPIGEQMQINLYAYVDNRPINSFDPLGLVGEGIITLGEIPGVAEKLNALHAKLLNKAVSVGGGSVKKTEFTSWLAKVGPEVFIQLYAQAIYDELQTQLEDVVRNLGVCYVVNLEYAGSGNENGEIEVKEYAFPALTKPWTWSTAPTVKRAMKYEPCPDNCYWRVYYFVPTAKDFSAWKEVERFSCSGTPRCRKTL